MSNINLDQTVALFVGNMTSAIVILGIFYVYMVISAFEIQDK